MGGAIFKVISKKGEERLPKLDTKSLLELDFKALLPADAAVEPISSVAPDKKVILCVNVATK